MAIGINLLLLLLHKHQHHYLVNTTTTSSTSSCSSSSSTNSSKSSSSTTHSSSSSTTDSSTSSSTTTISTSSHHQWPNPPRRVPSGRPPWLRARPAPKKKKRRALRQATRLIHWHEKEAQSRMFTSCTRVQRRFSYLLSLSSSDSKPLPLSFPNEDSSPEPILSESRPRSTPSVVVHTQSVRKERPWKKIDKNLWVTSLRAAITQKLQMATWSFLGMVGRCFWLRNSWTRSQRDQTTDWWENDVRNSSALGCGSMYVKTLKG